MPDTLHTYWHGFNSIEDAVAARRARIAAKEKAERERVEREREESFAASERARRGRTLLKTRNPP